MGGTSGSLYSIFFAGLAAALGSSASTDLTPESWAAALLIALENLYKCEQTSALKLADCPCRYASQAPK